MKVMPKARSHTAAAAAAATSTDSKNGKSELVFLHRYFEQEPPGEHGRLDRAHLVWSFLVDCELSTRGKPPMFMFEHPSM